MIIPPDAGRYISTLDSIVLSSTSQNEALLPGPIIPDGQGGILATWTVSAPVVLQYPYEAADVTNGVELLQNYKLRGAFESSLAEFLIHSCQMPRSPRTP
jgi:hypothetical protein